MPTFVAREQQLHVSSGEQIAHAILAGTQDSSGPTQYVPLWSTQLERRSLLRRDQGKMKQHVSTSQSGKRSEDRQGNDDYEFSGFQRSKKKHEVTRKNEDKKKKQPRKDEGQKLNEKEEERKRRTQKRMRKRSRNKDMCEFSEEKEQKELKIRRKMKAESADPDSVDEADL